jgi:PAS domain-containing protein
MTAGMPAHLQSRDALLTSLYGQLPVGVAIFDMELHLQHNNASWASFIEYATGIPAANLVPGTRMRDVMANDDDLLRAIDLVRNGEVLQKSGHPFPGPAGETYWDVSLAPVIDDGIVTGIISVIADATPRVIAERATAARARLTAFRADVSEALASSQFIGPNGGCGSYSRTA